MSAATRTHRTVLGTVNVYDAYNVTTHEYEGFAIPGAVMREAAELNALVGKTIVVVSPAGQESKPMTLHSVSISGGYVGVATGPDEVPHVQISASDHTGQNLYAGALDGDTVEAV